MMLAERMELLTKRPQGTLFPPAQNRAAWETLPANDRMDIEAFIAKWRGTPYPMLLLSDYAARAAAHNAKRRISRVGGSSSRRY